MFAFHSRYPVGIDLTQRLRSALSLRSLKRSDEDTVRAEQVSDGSPFREERWVGQNVETRAGLRVGLEDGTHGLGSSAWHGGFLDDDLGCGSDSGNSPRSRFDVAGSQHGSVREIDKDTTFGSITCKKKEDVLEISSETSSHTGLLGGSVDTDEDEVCLSDTLVYIS